MWILGTGNSWIIRSARPKLSVKHRLHAHFRAGRAQERDSFLGSSCLCCFKTGGMATCRDSECASREIPVATSSDRCCQEDAANTKLNKQEEELLRKFNKTFYIYWQYVLRMLQVTDGEFTSIFPLPTSSIHICNEA